MESNFVDSPELAKRDAAITILDYHAGQFRTYFTTPYEQHAEYVGKPFTVVEQTRELKIAKDNEDGEDDMYLIRFEDGTEIDAFGHEVCVLQYDKCRLPSLNEDKVHIEDLIAETILERLDAQETREAKLKILLDVIESATECDETGNCIENLSICILGTSG